MRPAPTGPWTAWRQDAALYRRFLGARLRSQMQYRASFLMMTLASLLSTGTELLAILILFHQFGDLAGWQVGEVALLYGLVAQDSVWYPINLLAGVAIPGMAGLSSEGLRAFSLPALIIGVIVHGVISVLAGLLYAVILPMLPRRHLLWGGLVAPLLWTGLVWATLGVVNPALNARIDWVWFIASQIAFGLTTGFVVSRAQPIATMQTWPLAARAGVETTGIDLGRERDR